MAPPPVDVRSRILETLRQQPGLTQQEAMTATTGASSAIVAGLRELQAEGLVVRRTRAGRGQGHCYYLADGAPPTVAEELQQAKAGQHPGHRLVAPQQQPPGYKLRGVSTLYGEGGEVKSQWVKTDVDREQQLELLREAVAELAEPWRGVAEPTPAPANLADDLLCLYPMGDPHIGMYAWGRESGEDFDLGKAEADLLGAVDYLTSQAPPARRAVVASLGDFFHSDNFENRTARSGHALDVDGRFPKVVATGLRIFRRIVDRALERHEQVTVVPVVGNHDDHTSVMLGIAMAALYEREPRVTVDTSPAAFRYVRHGRCLLGFTHGHTAKPDKLQGVMAADEPEQWGQTRHRHWHTGHIHQHNRREYAGCTWESHRTLAPRDAYAAGAGYRSGRGMLCITYHRDLGELHRHTAGIELVRALREAG